MAAPTDDALVALSRLPGLEIVHRPALDGGANVVDVRTAAGTDRYVIETRRRITSGVVPALLSHLEQLRAERPEPPLLLSDYVSPATAVQLQKRGVAYADAAGDAHLDGRAAFVHIQGQRPQRKAHTKGLTATDLTLVFAILSRPRPSAQPWNSGSARATREHPTSSSSTASSRRSMSPTRPSSRRHQRLSPIRSSLGPSCSPSAATACARSPTDSETS